MEPVTGFLTARFEERPAAPAVISPAASCDFAGLAELVWRSAVLLERHDVRPGTVVALAGDFTPVSIALLLALADRGAIVVPHTGAGGPGRAERDAVAQVEASFDVGRDDVARFERTGRSASHELYAELRRRALPGLVQFSSGTSGEPKAAVHDLSRLLEKFRLRRPARTTLAFLLFDHLGGINTMLHTLSNGATLVSTDDRSPDGVCALVERHRVELLPATPTFLNLLLLSGAARRYDLSTLEVISYGAEPMPAATLARLRREFPRVRLQQTYGMVELGALRTKSRDDDSLWVKVGGEGVETRVVDGMLQVRSRSQLLGYLNAPTPITSDGWFETGDLVEQDGEHLRFLGRDSDLINVGGEKVHPAEVEGVIESIDGVAEATVYGEPNGLVGQIVCARVTPSDAAAADGLAREVRRFCRERLDRFKVPVRVEVAAVRREGADRVKKSRRRVDGPLCFMHVPKCAGTSVHVALEAAFPDGAVAPRRSDTSVFCGFSDFDRLDAPARALVAVGDGEVDALAAHRVVSGHFALPSLLRVAPAANVATVLREPRARMLSGYMFLRLGRTIEFWGSYGREVLAGPASSLEASMAAPALARTTDNQACRLLLHGDPRLRDGEFVADGDVEGVAAAALERLQRLGYVGLLEADDVWEGLSRFFGVSLAPVRANASGSHEVPEGALPIPEPDMRVALDLIERRTAADRIVYGTLLEARCGGSEARRIADAAFSAELVRFGDLTGSSATRLAAADRLEESRA